MGDRTNPMKFGPEWLRNLSREPGSNASGGQSNQSLRPVTTISNTAAAGDPAPRRSVMHNLLVARTAARTNANVQANATPNPPNTARVLLAKLRYGKEEMLALFDRQMVEAPAQLKSIEPLYNPRCKTPYALSNNFEDDVRDSNMRSIQPAGGLGATERYSAGRARGMGGEVRGGARGAARGAANIEVRGRGSARGYVRQSSLGSEAFRNPNWHVGGQRSYPGTSEDEPRGLWNTGTASSATRPLDQADWPARVAYRKTRQNHTNWRQQPTRDEGEEWRATDTARRGQERWEREWPERDRPQEKPWMANRRQWSGDNNEDALPEWAVDSSDACAGGGTFDASGAFHGYSNDDSNLPKSQESAQYSLARSNTHNNVSRPRVTDEESEEWWASEKAKKLSAKRFNATEVKFKKPATSEDCAFDSASGVASSDTQAPTRDKSKTESDANRSTTVEEFIYEDGPDMQDEAAALPIKTDASVKDKTYKSGFTDSSQTPAQQRIDILLRSDDRDCDRGNYKSVMMNSGKNQLRKQHQKIRAPYSETLAAQNDFAQLFSNAKQTSEEENQQKEQDNKLVDNILEMNLSEEVPSPLLNSSLQEALNEDSPLPRAAENPRLAPTPIEAMMRHQPSVEHASAISNSMLNASLGLPMTSRMPSQLIPNAGLLSNPLQGFGNMQVMQSTGLQGMQSGMQVPNMLGANYHLGMQGNMQNNLQVNMQNIMQGNMQNNMQGNMQNNMQGNMQNNMQGNMQSNMQGNMQSNMQGNMQSNLQVNMQNNLQGNMQSNMQGNMQSNLQGSMQSNLQGNMPSNMQGNMQNCLQGNISSNLQGNMQSSLQGNMPSSLHGNNQTNLQGHMQSSLQGSSQQGNVPTNLQGNMQSNLSGNMSTNLQGNIQTNLQRNMQSNLPGNMPSSLQGNISTNLQGNIPGSLQGNMPSNLQTSSLQGNLQSSMPGNMQPDGLNTSTLQPTSGIPSFQSSNSLFMQGHTPPNSMQNANDIASQQSAYSMHGHGLPQPQPQGGYSLASMYNLMTPPPPPPLPDVPLSQQWFYEDPEKKIQGPFTMQEMRRWYRAGFFSRDLLVGRACDPGLAPLASYGVMPFRSMELLPPQSNQMAGRFDMHAQSAHDNSILNAQAGLGPEVKSLWNQPTAGNLVWFPPVNPLNDPSINNLSMFYWEQVRE